MSCRTSPLRGGDHFVMGIPLRVVLPLVAVKVCADHRPARQRLTFDYPRRSHHTARRMFGYLPRMDTEHSKHRLTNPVGYEHTHRQRRQHRANQYNRRNHTRSSTAITTRLRSPGPRVLTRRYCYKPVGNYNDSAVNCVAPSDTSFPFQVVPPLRADQTSFPRDAVF
jgi:hypothetical protein